jgi:ParB family chromosome partitioning protein
MQSIVHVNPFRCQMWSLHDRIETYITEETCRAEIDSFMKHGQLVPVLGRALRGDPNYDIELIYGARRLFVARHINKPLKVEVREMSDREALIAMDIENRQRTDISPYERGQSYARWLRSAHFQSQDDIARALKVSSSQVSRLLKLARLPTVIVDAFANPAEICEGWGLELINALEDPERRPAVIRRARAISTLVPRPAGRDVYHQLLIVAAVRAKLKPRVCAEVIKDAKGKPLFRVRQQSNSVAIVVPMARISAPVLEQIRLSVAEILQNDCALAATAGGLRDTQRDGAGGRSRDRLHQAVTS